MSMAASTALAVIVASHSSGSVSAFAPTATVTPIDNLTSRNFRHMDDSDLSIPTNLSSDLNHHATDVSETQQQSQDQGLESTAENDEAGSCTVSSHFSMSSAPLCYFSVNEQMPTWLRPSGSKAEDKLSSLRELMLNSYLSQLEAETVISAIREASMGDLNKMAGAADFCSVLVETMEMGVTTLIAAAFHYCECFVARQQSSILQPSTFSASEYWGNVVIQDQKERQIKFGHDADRIAKDAALLKQTEMLVGQSLRSKPNAKDSENIRKMLLSETNDWRALAIRSAGSLYRLRGIYLDRDERRKDNIVSPSDIRVAHEALAIHAPLASRLGMHRLKNEIEGAAFRVLYPRQYQKVMSLTLAEKTCDSEEGCIVSTLKEGMAIILDRVTDEVRDLLQKDPCFQKYTDNITVTARIKEPYSLWKKMLKLKAKQVIDVPDSLALRIVLQGRKMSADEDGEVTRARERALCYYAREKCIKTFQPLKDGRFKDYIINPKPNGYQSLHYTASTKFDGQQWPFEIQIRSNEMHQVAEFGLAAHWDYKEQERTSVHGSNNSKVGGEIKDGSTHYAFHLDHSSDAYLRSVQNWHWQQIQGKSSWGTDTSASNNALNSTSNNIKDQERSERQRARDERLAPYLKALMTDQSNLTREQVFIFLQSQENGITLALPAGSCILDAIRESERALGLTTSRSIEKQVEHNGSLASVTQKLTNGDILTIPFKM